MRAAVISLGSTSSKMIAGAMENYFKTVDMLNIKLFEVFLGSKEDAIFYDGKELAKYDCIYARGSSKYGTILNAITTILRKETYFPLLPKAYTLCHDKLLSNLRFEAKGIPTPKTFLASTADAGKRILDRITYPVVLKLPMGTHGKGVMFADSRASASSMIDALSLLRQPILMQEFIDTDGEDLRIMVLGDKAVAAGKRKAMKGDNRSNTHQGGSMMPAEIDPEMEKLAVEAAKACGCNVSGVDLLVGPKGPVVLEVNASPGLQGITAATGIDVADKIAQFLYKQTKKARTKKSTKAVKELMTIDEIIAPLDFRGTRILLPAFVGKKFKPTSDEEVIIKADKKKLTIERIKK